MIWDETVRTGDEPFFFTNLYQKGLASWNRLAKNVVRTHEPMAFPALALKPRPTVADVELIAKAIAGKEDGFEELVHRYQRPIVNYVFRMLGNYDSALDVTQDVFIKVYNSLAKYSSEYKFSTWRYRIRPLASLSTALLNTIFADL